VGAIAQSLKTTMRAGANWPRLSPGEQEALDLIAHRIARILSGSNPSDPEHWSDVAGHAHAAMRLWEQQSAGIAPAKPGPGGAGGGEFALPKAWVAIGSNGGACHGEPMVSVSESPRVKPQPHGGRLVSSSEPPPSVPRRWWTL
jgi:hypothetical protein